MDPSRLPTASTLSMHIHDIFRLDQTQEQQQTRLKIVVSFAHANGFCKEVWLPVMQMIQSNIATYLANSMHQKDIHERVIDLVMTSVDINGSGDTPRRLKPIIETSWNATETEVAWYNMGIDVLSALNQTSLVGNKKENSKLIDNNTKIIVLGVGHSMGGAASLFAEYINPGTFNRLVLFEPVFYEKDYLDMADERGFVPFHPLHDMTLKRRNWFPSKKAAFDGFKGRGLFSKWNEDTLRAYAEGALTPDVQKGSGVTLKLSREYEALGYLSTHRLGLKENIQKIKVPIDLAYGEESTFLMDKEQTKDGFERFFQNLSNKGTKSPYVIKDGSHFVVMEKVEEVSNIIMESICKAIMADTVSNQIQQTARL